MTNNFVSECEPADQFKGAVLAIADDRLALGGAGG